jgi:hypothetical protein
MPKTYAKGVFNPRNQSKYIGNRPIIWRSTWELHFMNYCDTTPGIVHWSSESIVIPYVKPTDQQVHRYFPDFRIDVRTVGGKLKTSIIEIKPRSQTKLPKPRKRTRKFLTEISTFAINEAKFAAARQYCDARGWAFLVLDETHLFGKKF